VAAGLGASALMGSWWARMGSNGPCVTVARSFGDRYGELTAVRDNGSMASPLQHGSRSFMGPPGLGWAATGPSCNISGLEARKGENTDVCIAFMHRNSGEFSRFKVKQSQ
jgi:hypothetical protein